MAKRSGIYENSWYGAMALAGFGFGLLADRRPFGGGLLAHPLVMFFILAGLGLLALRIVLARPVPQVISDRALAIGCVLGLAMFLAGNFVAVRIPLPV
jgi:ABC-type microcin C transport system permease subunit YejB